MKQCEFEDSMNCVWNAQEQGNGEGQSFVDIDGTVYYTEDPTVYTDVWEDEGVSFPYQYVIAQENGEDYQVIIWEGEPTVDIPVADEVVLETTEEVVVTHKELPTELAETGIGLELGIIGGVLIALGAWITIKGRD